MYIHQSSLTIRASREAHLSDSSVALEQFRTLEVDP